MAGFVDLAGPIEGITAYANDVLCARNSTVTLPEVTRVAVTQKTSLGEQDFATNLLEDMETAITKIGIDINSIKLAEANKLEYRWVQTSTNSEGKTTRHGCKAIMNVEALTVMPGASIEMGSASENDHTYKVYGYALYIDGQEKLNINKLTNVFRINGKDYGVNEALL